MIAETILVLIAGAGIFTAFFNDDELLPSILVILASVMIIFIISFKLDFDYLLLVGAIPLGLFIAWLSRDEIKLGRRWQTILIFAAFVLGLIFYFLGYEEESLSLFFMAIFTLTAVYKGYDKKWTRRKI